MHHLLGFAFFQTMNLFSQFWTIKRPSILNWPFGVFGDQCIGCFMTAIQIFSFLFTDIEERASVAFLNCSANVFQIVAAIDGCQSILEFLESDFEFNSEMFAAEMKLIQWGQPQQEETVRLTLFCISSIVPLGHSTFVRIWPTFAWHFHHSPIGRSCWWSGKSNRRSQLYRWIELMQPENESHNVINTPLPQEKLKICYRKNGKCNKQREIHRFSSNKPLRTTEIQFWTKLIKVQLKFCAFIYH